MKRLNPADYEERQLEDFSKYVFGMSYQTLKDVRKQQKGCEKQCRKQGCWWKREEQLVKKQYQTKFISMVLSNAQSLMLMAIVVIGIYLGFKREFSKLIGFLVVALIAVGLVFNAGGVKDVLLELFNKIIGA